MMSTITFLWEDDKEYALNVIMFFVFFWKLNNGGKNGAAVRLLLLSHWSPTPVFWPMRAVPRFLICAPSCQMYFSNIVFDVSSYYETGSFFWFCLSIDPTCFLKKDPWEKIGSDGRALETFSGFPDKLSKYAFNIHVGIRNNLQNNNLRQLEFTPAQVRRHRGGIEKSQWRISPLPPPWPQISWISWISDISFNDRFHRYQLELKYNQWWTSSSSSPPVSRREIIPPGFWLSEPSTTSYVTSPHLPSSAL